MSSDISFSRVIWRPVLIFPWPTFGLKPDFDKTLLAFIKGSGPKIRRKCVSVGSQPGQGMFSLDWLPEWETIYTTLHTHPACQHFWNYGSGPWNGSWTFHGSIKLGPIGEKANCAQFAAWLKKWKSHWIRQTHPVTPLVSMTFGCPWGGKATETGRKRVGQWGAGADRLRVPVIICKANESLWNSKHVKNTNSDPPQSPVPPQMSA